MVKTKNQIEKTVREFVREISKDYHVTQVILFGSYAKGHPHQNSDIDLAIISPDFRGKAEMQILQYLSRKAMKFDTALEVLAFTPEDLTSPDPRSFSYQVKTFGIPLAA